MSEIDYRNYVTPTRFSNALGIVLAIQLLRAAHASTDAVRAALEKLRQAAVDAQSFAVQRLRATPEILKPIDLRLDNGIVGLREALEAKARLVGTEISERAARLLALVFPHGTSFVTFSFLEEWQAVTTHLDRIDQDRLAEEIDAVVGPEFLPYIRAAHAELGEGLGVGETALTAPDSENLRRVNERLAKAIANYGRAMVATVDDDDPASIAAFKRAMYPLDAYRRAAFPKSAGTKTGTAETEVDGDIQPTDPIPPVPTDPSPTA